MLLNARVTAFIVSKLLKENQQGVGGGGGVIIKTPPPPHTHALGLKKGFVIF